MNMINYIFNTPVTELVISLNNNPLTRVVQGYDIFRKIQNQLVNGKRNYIEKINSHVNERTTPTKDIQILRYLKPSEKVKNILLHEVEECGIDPMKVKFIIDTSSKEARWKMIGSLKYTEQVVIVIPEEDYNSIESSGDILDDNKFSLRHELGHVFFDDISYYIDINTIINIIEVASHIFATYISIEYWAFGAITSIISSHLISKTISKITKIFVSFLVIRQMELRADEFSAQDSKALEGGIKWFQQEIDKSLEKKRELLEKIESLSYPIRKVFTAMLNCTCDNRGNDRLDFEHPPLTSRLSRLIDLNPSLPREDIKH